MLWIWDTDGVLCYLAMICCNEILCQQTRDPAVVNSSRYCIQYSEQRDGGRRVERRFISQTLWHGDTGVPLYVREHFINFCEPEVIRAINSVIRQLLMVQLFSTFIIHTLLYSSGFRVTRVLLMDANLSITLLFRSPVLRSFGKPNSDPFQYLWGDLIFFKVFRERTWEDGFSNQSSLWLPAGWNWVQSLTQLVQVSEQILYILNIIHIIIFQIITWPQRSGQTQLSMRGIISIGQWQSWRKVKCDDWFFSGEHWTLCLKKTIDNFRHSCSIFNQSGASLPHTSSQSHRSHHQPSHHHYQSQIQRCNYQDSSRWVSQSNFFGIFCLGQWP